MTTVPTKTFWGISRVSSMVKMIPDCEPENWCGTGVPFDAGWSKVVTKKGWDNGELERAHSLKPTGCFRCIRTQSRESGQLFSITGSRNTHGLPDWPDACDVTQSANRSCRAGAYQLTIFCWAGPDSVKLPKADSAQPQILSALCMQPPPLRHS